MIQISKQKANPQVKTKKLVKTKLTENSFHSTLFAKKLRKFVIKLSQSIFRERDTMQKQPTLRQISVRRKLLNAVRK